MRKLVIGDIHGANRALHQVLERCKFNPENDKLIFLGDYCDGWPETIEVFDTLIKLEESCKHKPIFIIGNHDQWLRDWLNIGEVNIGWHQNRGWGTYVGYKNLEDNIVKLEKHKEFLNRLRWFYIDGENNGFVHAGFLSKNGLGHEENQDIYCHTRALWKSAMEADNAEVSKNYRGHKEIFIGHTNTAIYDISPQFPEFKDPNQLKEGAVTVPMNRQNIWNIDTAAGFGGKLTILDVETKAYWQSDFVKTLYPEVE